MVLNVISCEKNAIPNELKLPLARLMKLRYIELFRIPVPIDDFFLRLLNISDEDVGETFVMGLGDKNTLVGFARLEYRVSENHDRTYATMNLFVKEEQRRKGYGSKLLSTLLKQLPPLITTIRVDIPQDSPGTFMIQEKLGVEKAFNVIFSVSKIKNFDLLKIAQEETLQTSRFDTRGYEFLYVNNDTISEVGEEFAVLMERVWNTVDRENSTKEDEKFPVERVLGMFDSIRKKGGTLHVFLARHKQSNKLVGLTETAIYGSNPKVGYQYITGVLSEHGSQGLGYALKFRSLSYLLTQTEVTHWVTENAQLNAPMLRINEKLRFEEWMIHNVYEIKSIGSLTLHSDI